MFRTNESVRSYDPTKQIVAVLFASHVISVAREGFGWHYTLSLPIVGIYSIQKGKLPSTCRAERQSFRHTETGGHARETFSTSGKRHYLSVFALR
jgi:hypothetical protein